VLANNDSGITIMTQRTVIDGNPSRQRQRRGPNGWHRSATERRIMLNTTITNNVIGT
jgi:hypothetical protein